MVQLHHAGMRSPKELIGEAPVSPWEDAETGARTLSEAEVEQLIEDFIRGAERAEAAGFDGVEIHGAHGYILCAFLSPEINRRTDRFGGALANRASVIQAIIDGIRARCRPDFILGLRLSPERFGLSLAEIIEVARAWMTGGQIDFLDMSLWDVAKEPVEEAFHGRSLMSYFTALERGQTRLGVAGKIMGAASSQACLEAGCDFVLIGRGAILHHNFPKLAEAADFQSIALPVTRDHLRAEGLGPAFLDYMAGWKGFVAETPAEVVAG